MALSLFRTISFLLLLLFLFGSGSVRAAEIDWFITNTTDVDGRPIRTDASVFNCSDQIYTMVSFSDLRDPSGTAPFWYLPVISPVASGEKAELRPAQ